MFCRQTLKIRGKFAAQNADGLFSAGERIGNNPSELA
jgi:hypothetical protein